MRKHDIDVFVAGSALGLICRIRDESGGIEDHQKFYKYTNDTDEDLINKADKWAIDRIHVLEARDAEIEAFKVKIEALKTKVKEKK